VTTGDYMCDHSVTVRDNMGAAHLHRPPQGEMSRMSESDWQLNYTSKTKYMRTHIVQYTAGRSVARDASVTRLDEELQFIVVDIVVCDT
jgi:hypothetical protein